MFTASAAAMRRFHLILTALWFAVMPLAVITGWIYSIAFISVISIYANFAGHFSSWQAARAEEKADEE